MKWISSETNLYILYELFYRYTKSILLNNHCYEKQDKTKNNNSRFTDTAKIKREINA